MSEAYRSSGVDTEAAAKAVTLIADLAACALLGGETAEHPGVMADDRFDLAGFCVGIVDGEEVLGPGRVRVGDALIGLPSTGLHANGFSLVRTVVTPDELAIAPPAIGRTFADELLAPCRIYVPEVLALHRDRLVHAADRGRRDRQ